MIYTREQAERDAHTYADALLAGSRGSWPPVVDTVAYAYALEQRAEWPTEADEREAWTGYDR
jgi:hypothetical protein